MKEVSDTLNTAVFEFEGGLTKVSEATIGGIATIFISGGTDASITCKVVTVDGRVDKRTLMIDVQER